MKKQIIIITIFIIFMIAMILKNNYSNQSDLSNYTILEKIIEGNSMFPLLRDGQKIYLIMDYYKTNTPKLGDIIAYDYGGGKHAYIKQVKATSNDDLEIVGKNLKINGKIMKNSILEIYNFTVGELKLIGIYIKNGHIPEDSYLIFGDNVTYSTDSRKFGVVSRNDLLGKFIIK